MSGIWARAERKDLSFVVKIDGFGVNYYHATDDPTARQKAIDRARELDKAVKIKTITVEKVESFHDNREVIWPGDEEPSIL